MIAPALIQACAPTVAPATVERVIQVESKDNPLAINVNGTKLARPATSAADATALATAYIKAGYSVDLGLMQVNSGNLQKLGYSVADMFDPCKNLAAGAKVLTDFYMSAHDQMRNPQVALRAALSAYNTGNFIAGFRNGYVARYFTGPLTASFDQITAATGNGAVELHRTPPPAPKPLNPFTATTVVYVRQEEPTMQKQTTQPVISTNEADSLKSGVQVEQTAEQAERNGAFEETAITEADAWESNADLSPQAASDSIVVNGKTVTSPQE